ncbi:hypothetical protein CALVIDRAFT_586064 [Calocera viscosa TUFC12733]|uniref:Flavin reductase like domain-containing protein n=1 Tax=Calocera viscosa (strain TUFC12733) TaxID=1330018 RepID=A0A167I5B1_CALVF|nr:hypothetical protein CALVIDRAFT_586064 [Calocera viscosa TUFC12733]
MSLPPFDPSFQPKHTAPPNPEWQFGDAIDQTAAGREWLEGEKAGWKTFDTMKTDGTLYPLMISGIVPRPVAFVSTVSEDGIENLAAYRHFPLLPVSKPLTHREDTAHNIKTTKQFTVNIISEPFVENANATAIDAPEEFNEWPLSGLTRAESVIVKPPRVKESAFSMECEFLQAIDIKHPDYDIPGYGDGTNTLIIGVVRYIHVRKDVLTERGNAVDPVKLKPVCRLGDISFARIGDMYRLPRLSWEQEKDKIEAALAKKQ